MKNTDKSLPLDTSAPKAAKAPRRCVYVSGVVVDDETGQHIPSLVTEGEPGHAPLSGDPSKLQQPWLWGTYEQACEIADGYNQRLGLSKRDVAEIICSSMRAHNNQRRTGEAHHVEDGRYTG